MREPLSRASIADAAREILITEGLQGVSLRKVAGKLGVTAPALYAHVVDKRDLLQTIADQELQTLLKRFHDASGTGFDRAITQAEAYAEWAGENPAVFRALFLFRPELTAEQIGDEAPLADRILEPFRESMRSADLEDAEASAAASTLFAAVHGAIVMRLAGPVRPGEGDLPNQVIRAVVGGLRRGDFVGAPS